MADGQTYGWYSQQAEVAYGSHVYLTSNDLEVVVTMTSPGPTFEEYLWKDKVCVGLVTSRVRQHTEGMYQKLSNLLTKG